MCLNLPGQPCAEVGQDEQRHPDAHRQDLNKIGCVGVCSGGAVCLDPLHHTAEQGSAGGHVLLWYTVGFFVNDLHGGVGRTTHCTYTYVKIIDKEVNCKSQQHGYPLIGRVLK